MHELVGRATEREKKGKKEKYLFLWQRGILPGVMVFLFCLLPGCDAVYRAIQKEGAEEKDLVGEISPFHRNEKVAEVQKLLKTYGYRVGSVDGVLGATSRDAVEQFQLDNDLPASRFVDKATWAALIKLEQCGLVYDGDLVPKAVQQALREAGFNPGSLDGKMGQMTKTAILEFQKANKLKADGKVGFLTLKKLADYLPPYNKDEKKTGK